MIGHWLNEAWEHWQYGTVVDAWGGTTTGFTRRGDVTVRHRPLSGNYIIRDSANTIVADAKFYMATTESVKVGDELRHATSGDYQVTAVIDPMSMSEFLQVEARKL